MKWQSRVDLRFDYGCWLATTAEENNQSLIECCRKMGRNKDWFSRHLIDPRPLLKRKSLVA
jgi:hypothetical protein